MDDQAQDLLEYNMIQSETNRFNNICSNMNYNDITVDHDTFGYTERMKRRFIENYITQYNIKPDIITPLLLSTLTKLFFKLRNIKLNCFYTKGTNILSTIPPDKQIIYNDIVQNNMNTINDFHYSRISYNDKLRIDQELNNRFENEFINFPEFINIVKKSLEYERILDNALGFDPRNLLTIVDCDYPIEGDTNCIDRKCSICYEDITENCVKLHCKHCFHRQCILQWRNINNPNVDPKPCPVCRNPFFGTRKLKKLKSKSQSKRRKRKSKKN